MKKRISNSLEKVINNVGNNSNLGGDKADNEFDKIVGVLEEILLDEHFELL